MFEINREKFKVTNVDHLPDAYRVPVEAAIAEFLDQTRMYEDEDGEIEERHINFKFVPIGEQKVDEDGEAVEEEEHIAEARKKADMFSTEVNIPDFEVAPFGTEVDTFDMYGNDVVERLKDDRNVILNIVIYLHHHCDEEEEVCYYDKIMVNCTKFVEEI